MTLTIEMLLAKKRCISNSNSKNQKQLKDLVKKYRKHEKS